MLAAMPLYKPTKLAAHPIHIMQEHNGAASLCEQRFILFGLEHLEDVVPGLHRPKNVAAVPARNLIHKLDAVGLRRSELHLGASCGTIPIGEIK